MKIARIGSVLLAMVFVALGSYAAVHWQPDRPVDALTARWAEPPSTFIAMGGMHVHVRDEGPRDAERIVVLLHGTASSLHTWDGWAEQLIDQYRVVRFDLPGFGLTGPHAQGDYSIAAYADFVVGMLDALKIEQATIAGNSLGGNIAWATAVEFPDRVERLVLIDSSGYRVESQSVPIAFRIAGIPLLNRAMESVLPRKFVRSSVENVFGDPSLVTDDLVDRYFDLATREGNRAAMAERFRQLAPGADAHRIPDIQQPTLILWGKRDALIPLVSGQRFLADIPNSSLEIFDTLGHIPQEEDPTQSLAPVLPFLAAGTLP